MNHLPHYIYPLRITTLIKGYCDIIPRLASPDTIEGWLDIIIQPPAIPLERGKQHPNPLLVPHTLGDIKIGGHPQTPGRR